MIELTNEELRVLEVVEDPPDDKFGPTSKTLFRLGLLDTAEDLLEPCGFLSEFDGVWQLTELGKTTLKKTRGEDHEQNKI